MRWLSLCALLCLAACGDCGSADPPSLPAVRDAIWLGYPRPHVVASEGLAGCQRAAVAASAAWWGATLGEPLPVRWAPPGAFELAMPPQGVIAVTEDPPTDPGKLATGVVHLNARRDRVHSAESQLGGTCEVRVVAHELGHALGWLDHAPGPGRLMSDPFPTTSWAHP